MSPRPLQSDPVPFGGISRKRIGLFGSAVLVLLLALVLRLWFLQVVGAQDFATQAQANTVRTQLLPAPRGAILDRKGRPLATNRDGWDVVGVPADLDTPEGLRVVSLLARALGEQPKRFRYLVRRNNQSNLTAAKPVTFKEDIPADGAEYLALSERIGDFPGIRLQRSDKRTYPEGDIYGHLIGAVGLIPAERADALAKAGYRPDALVGVRGLEQYYESYLKGQDGSRRVEVDVRGEPTSRGVISETPAKPGNTIITSIDLDVQRTLAQQLREKVLLNGARYSGGGGVVLNVQTGEVVALASFPNIDPNKLSAGKAPYKKGDPRKPENNRATSAYPAASTMKPFTALAALESGVLSPTELIEAPKRVKIEGQQFNNFRELNQGFIPLPEALKVSSDTYFYKVAYERIWKASTDEEKRTGQNALWRWFGEFGFGQVTNLDMMPGESAGALPDRLWKAENLREGSEAAWNLWRVGDTVNMSIGQGYLKVSPVQLARAYAAMLDPEHRLQTPTIANRIVDPTSQQTVFDPLRARQAASEVPPLKEENLESIKTGLLAATTQGDGTAVTVFSRFGGLMAGKTGTAENPPRPDHAWFVGYGPAGPGVEPKYVVAVIVENAGLGGQVAAPVACKTLAVALDADPNRCGKGSTGSD